MMKKLFSFFLSFVLIFALSACGGTSDKNSSSESSATKASLSDVKANIFALKGPTGMGMVSLMDKSDKSLAALDYNFSLVSSNDEIVAKITNGEADIAAVATNLASTLYKRTNGGIKVLAVNTLGVLYLVTKGETISSVADLKGKTIYSTGQAANPEYILDYILTKNGLTPGEDVKIEFLTQNEELISKVVSSDKAIVLAPQPVASSITVKDSSAAVSINMTEEWQKVCDTKLVMGCIIARNDYLQKNAAAVKAFLNEYKASADAVNADNDTAAKLCEQYGIVPSAAIAKKALPYCNIVFEDGSAMKNDLSAYLEILYGYSPSSIGGNIPDSAFYYE